MDFPYEVIFLKKYFYNNVLPQWQLLTEYKQTLVIAIFRKKKFSIHSHSHNLQHTIVTLISAFFLLFTTQ